MPSKVAARAHKNRSAHRSTIRKNLPGNPTAEIPFDLAEMQSHAGDAARLLKALANERRLQILCLLAEKEHSVGEINALLELSQSALSQHLAVLREENLVQTRREAQTVYYSLRPGPAAAVIATLHGIYCKPSPQSSRSTT